MGLLLPKNCFQQRLGITQTQSESYLLMRNQHKPLDFQCHCGHFPCYSSPTMEDTDAGLARVKADWGFSLPLGQPRQVEQANGV